jgi:hypothetical protein
MCSSKPKSPKPTPPPAPAAVKDTVEADEAVSKEDLYSTDKKRKRSGKKSLRVDKAGIAAPSGGSGLAVP